MKKNIPNILLACDNTLASIGLKHLITEIKTAVAITEVNNEKDLLFQVQHNSYEFIFIHENLYTINRTDLFQILQQKNTNWFVLGNGTDNPDILLNIAAPEQEIAQFLRGVFNQKTAQNSSNALSEREKEVLKCVAKGMTNKEISEALFISLHTVITHRKNITTKLEIKTIPGLTIYAILNNIIDANEVNL